MSLRTIMLIAAMIGSEANSSPVLSCDVLLDAEEAPGLCEIQVINGYVHPYNPRISGDELTAKVTETCQSEVKRRSDARARLFQAKHKEIYARFPRFDPEKASDHQWFLLTFVEYGVCSNNHATN